MKAQLVSNPFALMMDPQAVLAAMERSDRLQLLQRHVCRPLDKPVLARCGQEADDFDHAIDDEPEIEDQAGPQTLI